MSESDTVNDSDPYLNPGERLILVSNRLPVILKPSGNGIRAEMAAGGLATGLSRPHRETGGCWIGWPGITSPDQELAPAMQEALAQQNMVGVPLTEEEHLRYYTRISNRCLWPLFHYFTDQVRFNEADWDCYQRVNRKFADAVLKVAKEDDIVFVQDFHLTLVPQMLREAMPNLRIGFFLHIPFPSSEIYRILPRRAEVLKGLLGADMIAFHTLDYVRHFRVSLRRVLGLEVGTGLVSYDGRKVHLAAQPLGIDAETWQTRSRDPQVQEERMQLQQAANGRRIILGVDRLDYTKGIPARLQAFAKLLESHPELVDQVMMVQVAVPSRVEVEEYRDLKDEVDRLAGNINSRFGRPGLQPLHYQFRGVSPQALTALYQESDVALVTPLRDGLNLVAKEYIAARQKDDGVLILGEFTGAAWELGEALKVNPFDIAAMAGTLKEALDMSAQEQARRMRPLRSRVRQANVHVWARRCLERIRNSRMEPAPPLLRDEALQQVTASWQRAKHRLLFLDYDGTLRALTQLPGDAVPDAELKQLIRALALQPGLQTWIVSGRPPELLEEWLGRSGVGLIAEHGAFMKAPSDNEFAPMLEGSTTGWRSEVMEIFEQFRDRVPGSLIEVKPFGLAWHYRASDPALSAWQGRELAQHLAEVLAGQPAEVLLGDKVVEVRPTGIDKGAAVQQILRGQAHDADFILAAGDDQTDEDLFKQLPEHAVTLLIGDRPSNARYRLTETQGLRQLLRNLLDALAEEASSTSLPNRSF